MFWARFLCRICATIGTTSYPIFEKSTNRNIEAKIKRCLNLNVFEDDFKPKMICSCCYVKLNEIYEFVELCHASNSKFEHILYQSGRTSQVLSSSWSERPHNADLNLVQDENCVIMGPKTECPDFMSMIEYKDSLEQLNDQPVVDTRCFQNKSYVQEKHSYGESYVEKYEENPTVLRHSSQFQNKVKQGFSTNGIPHNVTVQQEYNITNVHYEHLHPSYKEPNDTYQRNHVIPISEDLTIKTNNIQGSCSVKQTLTTEANEKLSSRNFNETNNSSIIVAKSKENDTLCNKASKKINLISVETIRSSIKISEMKETKLGNATNVKKNNEILKSNKPKTKCFTCSECNKSFTRKLNLSAHMAQHTNNKPHVCEICKKSFALRWDLTTHKRVHTNLYQCTYCSKGFSVPSKLERHLRTHTNTRPFACTFEDCGKTFSDKRNMDGHMLTHSDVRKFLCDACNKSFKTKSQLKDHLRVHSLEMPFRCNICTKSYKWKTNLVLHLKKHNGYTCQKCRTDCGTLAKLIKHRKECKGRSDDLNT